MIRLVRDRNIVRLADIFLKNDLQVLKRRAWIKSVS
jgi:hypothetical protein